MSFWVGDGYSSVQLQKAYQLIRTKSDNDYG